MGHFFSREDRQKIASGQITAGSYEAHLFEGAALPAYEPVDDDWNRSHQWVEAIRKHIEGFDATGGYGPDRWEPTISNLFLLADLANAVALHMRAELNEVAAEEAVWEQRRAA